MNNQKVNMVLPCAIQCAAPEDGKPAKNPTFEMDAYNGGIMDVAGFGPVVVDIAGMRTSDVVPILFNHVRGDINNVLGQTTKIEKSNELKAYGEIMSDGATAASVVGLSKRGFGFQASIGVSPVRLSQVAAGQTVEANGRTHDGPFTFVSESVLDEISVVTLGADRTTRTAIKAAKPNRKKGKMDGKQDEQIIEASAQTDALASAKKALDEVVAALEEVEDEAVSEGEPVDEDAEVEEDVEAEGHEKDKENKDEMSASALASGLQMLAEKVKGIQATMKANKIQADRPNPPAIQGARDEKVTGKIIEAAACLRAGLKTVESEFDANTLERANDLRIRSMTDLVRCALSIDGKRLECTRHDTRDFLQAAFSTVSMSNILSNVANKFIMEGFGTVEETWKQIASIRSVVDFKANTGVRLVMANLLQALAPNGEIQHGTLSDETRSIQADTKALMLAITRKDLINDDLSALTDVPRRLGFAAARTFNTDFWAAWTAALATAFPVNNSKGNYLNVALSLANLASAEQAFMSLTDSDGNPIGTDASVLLVAPGNSVLAREIFISTNLVSGNTTKSTASNPFVGRYTPAATRYLSGNGWALLANPLAIPAMEVAFLNGQQEPVVETADADFNTLGVQMRCYYDYGVAFAEDKAGVYSAGG